MFIREVASIHKGMNLLRFGDKEEGVSSEPT